MIWEVFEEKLGEKLPHCIKEILTLCGYNTYSSLRNISPESILQMEICVNKNYLRTIQKLNCCHSDFYKKQDTFKFLPGHTDLLLMLPKFAINCFEDNRQNHNQSYNQYSKVAQFINQHSGFSRMMKELINTVLENETNSKNNTEYSDIVKYFATYLFTLCGRSCYEFLYANLPIPSISTIRKINCVDELKNGNRSVSLRALHEILFSKNVT